MDQPSPATFSAAELAIVLSHFDLGVIQSITAFPRGSRSSPKAGIVAEHGKFLLKRRAVQRCDPDRIRLAHRVEQALTDAGFPAPRLIRTRSHGQTDLQLKGNVYEMFEFVAGEPYRRTPPQTHDAGNVLARFHEATAGLPTRLPVPAGDYHDAMGIRTGLCSIGATLSSHDSFAGNEADLADLIQHLLNTYDRAASAVNESPFSQWPSQLLHGDWHPGNLLFRRERVVAVLDYDALRRSRRVLDVANGALQFSLLTDADPAKWPAELDEQRFALFLEGYAEHAELRAQELECIPHLMIEALIAECVPPITQTGTVGQWQGFRVLQMVRHKTDWLAAHAAALIRLAQPV